MPRVNGSDYHASFDPALSHAQNAPRILWIDSGFASRETSLAQLADYSVDRADTAGGLELAHTHSYEAILLELRLPHVRGFAVLDDLRLRRPDVPIILLTSHADLLQAVAHKYCLTEILIKPVIDANLLRALGRVRLAKPRTAETPEQELRSALAAYQILVAGRCPPPRSDLSHGLFDSQPAYLASSVAIRRCA